MTDILKKHFDGIEAKFGPLPGQVNEALARLTELEQRGARRSGGSAAANSWGQEFIQAKGADLSALNENPNGRLSFEIKAPLTSERGGVDGAAGDLAAVHRDPLTDFTRQRPTIRDLLTVIPVVGGSVEYPQQAGRELNADVVPEGAPKPESTLAYEMRNTPIRTIAHFIKASRQILEDAAQLKGEIDAELRRGLILVEEQEILFGDGTGVHLQGISAQVPEFNPAFTVDAQTGIDELALGILQATQSDVPPDGIVVNPVDWLKLRLTKDTTGNYILGAPGVPTSPSLFNLPVVATPAMTEGNFLVGAFKPQRLYDRWKARVEVGFVNDDFTRNMVTILGEERIGLAVKAPEALILGTFSHGVGG
jgi:HK97 family phage major capsid protein